MMQPVTHWPAVLAAMAAGVVSGAAISKISPALPLLKSEFGLSLIATGWLVSTFNTIALGSAILFGLFCDRAGALRFCLWGLACMMTGGLLGAFAPSAAWIIVSRVIEGAGYVAIMVSAPGLIAAASAPMQRGLAFGLWGTHMPIGGVAVLLASPVLFALFGWRAVWASVAALAAMVMVFLAFQARHYTGMHAGTPRSLASVRVSLAQPVPWLLGVAFGAYTLQFYAVMMWLPTYLLQTRSTDASTSALLTAGFVLVNGFGNMMGGWFMHRKVTIGRIIGVSFAITTVVFLGIFSNSLPDAVRFACVLAYGYITGHIPPAVFSGSVRHARSPSEAGSIQGMIVQVSNVGIFAGPPLIAAAVTHGGGWGAALWVILCAAAVGLLASFAIARCESNHRPSGSVKT
jgi:predicted MFS family arabinose efflux permease